ncbi:hypothetical protein KY359_06710 [Candidatus Woesearchaeota archaeon]|nr:hypothetical protein [Candidatus Woesearchaeota archaeon]
MSDATYNIEELRKRISLLQWDIPNIQNNELKARKEAELLKLRAELDTLRSVQQS